MTIRHIRLKNFKSHVHTRIEFTRYTCIIGMNGSGKSNVVDAICYILGYDLLDKENFDFKNLIDLIHEGEKEMLVEAVFEMKNENMTLSRELRHKADSLKGFLEVFKIDDEIVTKKQYLQMIKNLKSDCCVITQKNASFTSIFENLNDYLETISGSSKFKKPYDEVNSKLKKEMNILKSIFKKIKIRTQSQRESELENQKKQELDHLLSRKAKLEKHLFKNKIQMRNNEIDTLKMNLDAVKSDIDHKKRDMKKIQSELKEIRSTINKNQVEYIEVKNKYKNVLLSENEDFHKQKQRNLKEIQRIDKHIQNLQGELANQIDESAHKRLREEYFTALYKFKKDNYKLLVEEETHKATFNKSNENKKQIEKLQKSMHKNKNLLKNKNLKIEELRVKIAEADFNEYESLKKKEKELNDVLSYFLIYKNSLKIEKSKSQIIETLQAIFPGVKGKLSSLLRPTQKKYFLAIESLLTNKNTLIVDTKETALKCISYLESKKLCRLTFFCIDSFKNTRRSNENQITHDMVVQAKDCISYDAELEQIVCFLFSNCYILMDNSKKDEVLLRKETKNIKLCTLQGTLFQKNYITGGPVSVNIDSDLLSQLNQIHEKIRRFDHISVIIERIEEINEEIKIMNIENNEMTKEITSMEEENKKYSLSANEYHIITEKIKELKIKKFKKFFKKDFNTLESLENFLDSEKIQSQRRENQDLLDGYLKEKNSIAQEIDQLNLKIKSLENEKKLKIDFENISRILQELRTKYDSKRSENDKIVLHLSDQTKDQIHLKDSIERIEFEKEEIIQEAIIDEIIETEISDEFDDKENIINQEQKINLKDDSNSKEMELATVNLKIEEIYAVCFPTTKTNSVVKKELQDLNQEYEKKKKETKELREVFRDLRKKRITTFYECYNSLCDTLTKVMTCFNLTVQLTCLNKIEPYLKEIKFYIMKNQFTEYSSLSGGEKALIMVGFILAVNIFSGSTFCVFDEIDSALDRDYVIQVSEALAAAEYDIHSELTSDISIDASRAVKNTLKNLQIICISHKKEFFTNAESLIGVYKDLNESRIIGYKLN